MIRHLISQAAERCGYEIRSLSKTPGPSIAGIAYLPIRTVLDVGANRGQFARHALRLFPDAKIYSFEPLPDAYAELQAWMTRGNPEKLAPLQIALGANDGAADMFVHQEHDASSSLLQTTEHARELYAHTARQARRNVQVRSLDSLVRAGAVRLSEGTLLKIDVQGYELEVLRGAPASLKSIDAAVIEVGLQQLYRGQGSFRSVVEVMDDAGLRYLGNSAQVCDAQGRVVYVDAAFARAPF